MGSEMCIRDRGYTPDIFAGPAIGYLLENSPGAVGHQHVFWMLALFSFIGGIAASYYFQLYKKKGFNEAN